MPGSRNTKSGEVAHELRFQRLFRHERLVMLEPIENALDVVDRFGAAGVAVLFGEAAGVLDVAEADVVGGEDEAARPATRSARCAAVASCGASPIRPAAAVRAPAAR